MKNYTLRTRNAQDDTAPKFIIEQDKRRRWLWMTEHLGEPLKDSVLLGEVTESKRGWTCLTYNLTYGMVKLFYDRRQWTAEEMA